jgi:hypothetical protein
MERFMTRGWIPGIFGLLAATATAASSTDDITGRDLLNATLWMQIAPE